MTDHTTKKALILTSEASFRNLIAEYVEARGYEVAFSPEPSETVGDLQAQCQLVVLDWDAAGLEAISRCERIRARPDGEYVAIVAVDKTFRPEGMEEALQSGANLYMERSHNPQYIKSWVIAADRSAQDLADLRRSREKSHAYEEELGLVDSQIEDAFTKAHRLAVGAELDYLELDQIFQSAAAGILVVDEELNVLRCNRAFLDMAKHTQDEVQGKKCWEIFHSTLCGTPSCPGRLVFTGARLVEKEVERSALGDASTVHMVTATPLLLSGVGTIAGVLNFLDITDRVRVERALRKSEERFRVVVERAPYAQSIIKPDRTFDYVNPRFSEMFGYSLSDVFDERGWLRKAYPDPEYRRRFLAISDEASLHRSSQMTPYEAVCKVACKDGSEKIIEFRDVLLDNGFRVVTYLDMTGRVKAEEALRDSEKRYKELSTVDDLTRLYNKRHLNDRLPEEIEQSDRHGHSLSLLLLDIDDFKAFNDTYGHTEGDQVLARMGDVLINAIRQTDSAYRYGGEEFVVVLPRTYGDGAMEVAERIRARFEMEPFLPVPGVEVHKTVSVGVAEYRPHEDLNALLARADDHMYQAKRSGKNRVVFNKGN